MRTLILACLVCLFALPAVAQQPPQVPFPVPSAYEIGFQHPAPATVDRFESRLDGGAWTSVGKSVCVMDASYFCQNFPTLTTPGNHVVDIRACNAGGCSDFVPFAFLASVVPPATPTNPRVFIVGPS